ncbi:MAG: FAD-binding oxidoreductase [Sporichthyaceae bacterium]|nr:FAD-binding oxidoreductase [Sporichthyaceae bacterium]
MTQQLRDGFDGLVLEPGEDGYDAARMVWNAMVDRKPAVIARCVSVSDVQAAVQFGRAAGLEIGVRGGGHSVIGLPLADGALLVDLSLMDSVRVDPQIRRARVQGGALLGTMDRAAQIHGLGTPAGNVSHTGVGGLTLGGGTGWLSRLLGLSCDNVVSFEMVTADGSVLRASAQEHPELFWALRGGGGNFGVVTEFEFQLHPVGTRALVVDLHVEPDHAMDALRRWRDLLADAPRPATYLARSAVDGGPRAAVGYVWVGDPDEGRRLLPELRALCSPVVERVVEMSYVELQVSDDDVEGHLLRRYWKGHYLRELPDDAIRAFLAREAGGGFQTGGRLTAWGGAILDTPEDNTAFSHRDAQVEFTTAVGWTDPVEDGSRMAGARYYAQTLEPYASGVYVNALADEGQVGVRRAYNPEKLARLTAVKDRYDPDNVFHLNSNIPPSVAGIGAGPRADAGAGAGDRL